MTNEVPASGVREEGDEPKQTRVGMISLGCAKNTVDTEIMLGMLARENFRIVPDAGEADVIVINTCGFLKAAEEEGLEAILEMARRHKKLVVTGCLVQRHKENLPPLLPEVDGWVGTSEFARIGEVVQQVVGVRGQGSGRRGLVRTPDAVRRTPFLAIADNPTPLDPSGDIYPRDLPRYRTTAGPVAYVKIAEGCDHPCSFCIIPQLRGRFKSRPPQAVAREVRALVDSGIREIVLIAQDTTAYGQDLPGRPRLHHLLARLAALPGDYVLRLMYAYPGLITKELLQVMADEPKVLPYLDVPLQHSHPDILRWMQRPHRAGQTEEMLARARERVPGIALRTTFIVGFPGESDEHFAHLEDFVRRQRFDHVGVFTYSQEEGTPAGSRPDQVKMKMRRARRRRLLEVQQEVVRTNAGRWIGRTLRMLVEQAGSRPGEWLGRTYRDAPEVDGLTVVSGTAQPGEFVNVRIQGARLYDLVGDIMP